MNVCIYEKLLLSMFHVLDEGQLVEVSNYTLNFLLFDFSFSFELLNGITDFLSGFKVF